MTAPSTRITKPTPYKGFIITPTVDGTFTLVNPVTNTWAAYPTQRYAKWAATFLHNTMARFKPMEQ